MPDRWTAEAADEHGTPGLWAWDRGLPQLRYIARPDGADDRRVLADAYRLLRRLLCPSNDDVSRIVLTVAGGSHAEARGWRPGVRAVLAALADETGDE